MLPGTLSVLLCDSPRPPPPLALFQMFIFTIFMYFWLHWVFVASSRLSLVLVLGLLITVASLVSRGSQMQGASRAVVHGL